MLKKLVSMLVTMTLLLGTNTIIFAEEISANETPAYEITDEYVRIDYIEYEIVNNTIQYNGYTYEIMEYSLVRYEEDGTPVVLPLPVEQTKITDPERIAELNASMREAAQRSVRSTEYEDLPYTASVPEGQWLVQTPMFNLLTVHSLIGIRVRLYDFPLFADKEFDIRFIYYSVTGNWHEHKPYRNWTFSWFDDDVLFEKSTEMLYGQFVFANLYGDPSPSYKYTVSFTNEDKI